ncbi:hypothetical protein J1614_005736 [Plenodomus biglobosus]|nr:hypothetical protein J1614_005736 [Plenodomus biglobosus]
MKLSAELLTVVASHSIQSAHTPARNLSPPAPTRQTPFGAIPDSRAMRLWQPTQLNTEKSRNNSSIRIILLEAVSQETDARWYRCYDESKLGIIKGSDGSTSVGREASVTGNEGDTEVLRAAWWNRLSALVTHNADCCDSSWVYHGACVLLNHVRDN